MSAMDEVAPTTDGLDSVDSDGAPGVESPWQNRPPTAAAAGADVEVVSAPDQEETRKRPKQAQPEAKHTSLARCHRSYAGAQETLIEHNIKDIDNSSLFFSTYSTNYWIFGGD